MDFNELLRVYGPWGALAIIILWSYRDRIWALITRRQDRTEQDRTFSHKREVNGESYQRELVDRVLTSVDAERDERRELTRITIDTARGAESVASQAVEVMQDFADIARMQADRIQAQNEELIPLIKETKGVVEALWFFVTTQVQKRNGDYADELLRRAEERDTTEGERGESV